MERTMPVTLFVVLTGVVFVVRPAVAKEYYVGGPVVQNDLQIVPHYLLGIEMAPMPKRAPIGADGSKCGSR